MSTEQTTNPESIRDRIQELNAAVARGDRTIIIVDDFPNIVSDADLDHAFEVYQVRCQILKKSCDPQASKEAFMWGCRLMVRLLLLDKLESADSQERVKSLIEQVERYFNEELKSFPNRSAKGMFDFLFLHESISKSSDKP